MKTNPFIISGYVSPEFFCDREKETDRIINAVTNRRHLTLFSPRRTGKTGLIKHSFHQIKGRKGYLTVYLDIMATTSLGEFAEALGKAVFTSIGKNENIIKKLIKQLSALRIKVSIDPLSGEPALSLDAGNNREAERTLETIFRYIGNQHTRFVLAIDEFQQITTYPETNIEAVLRTHIQNLNNVSMIFSGSSRHILTEIFSRPNRPFYNSTEIMELYNIDPDVYNKFITHSFEKGGKMITGGALGRIREITGMHTFYVQYLCNRLFGSFNRIEAGNVNRVLLDIINENDPVYASYLKLLTPTQFRVLKAIALNEGIEKPTSNEFISEYELGAASSVSQAVKSLTDKDFIFSSENKLRLNDVFFSQWIINKA